MKWIVATLLVCIIVLPAVMAALLVSPWFFLAMALLMFVPLIFIKPGGNA